MSRILVPLIAVLCLLPAVPFLHAWAVPAWLGLLAGTAVGLSTGNPFANRTRGWTTQLLALSVVGLGAAMDLKMVALAGLQGLGYTFAGIALALAAGTWLARALRVRGRTGILVSVGTAICGGSAIAAMAPVIGAEDEDISVALGAVFLLNAVALLAFPPIGHALGLTERGFGLWAALAIHDTSSVVGAASTYGTDALTLATVTKLARALWIVPVTLAAGFWVSRTTGSHAQGKAKRPWFILGFVAAAALVTFLPVLRPAGALLHAAARRGLVLTLFMVGLGLDRGTLARVGWRALLHGLLLWILVGASTLGAIRAGWIR